MSCVYFFPENKIHTRKQNQRFCCAMKCETFHLRHKVIFHALNRKERERRKERKNRLVPPTGIPSLRKYFALKSDLESCPLSHTKANPMSMACFFHRACALKSFDEIERPLSYRLNLTGLDDGSVISICAKCF